jgi:hypothetical protein
MLVTVTPLLRDVTEDVTPFVTTVNEAANNTVYLGTTDRWTTAEAR